MLLHSQSISVERAGSPRLTFTDVALKAGEKTLVLGPSGSGKTTLLSVLAGLLHPTSGEVSFDGQNLYKLSPRERDYLRGRNYGFVFQTLHLLPSLTLRQNIMLAADMAKVEGDDKRVDYLLDNLGISGKAHRKPEALSQGEQQRGAIARAVLNRPKVILADEPTSALDDVNADLVMQLLIRQAENTGAALLIATHDNRILHHFTNIIRLERMKEAA